MELFAIVDEQRLPDLLLQLDQLTLQSAGEAADMSGGSSTQQQRLLPFLSHLCSAHLLTALLSLSPLVSLLPPAEVVRDDLLSVHEQERQRLAGLAEQLESEVEELEAEAARKRELLSDCERRIAVAVEFITKSRATVEKLQIADGSSAGKRS